VNILLTPLSQNWSHFHLQLLIVETHSSTNSLYLTEALHRLLWLDLQCKLIFFLANFVSLGLRAFNCDTTQAHTINCDSQVLCNQSLKLIPSCSTYYSIPKIYRNKVVHNKCIPVHIQVWLINFHVLSVLISRPSNKSRVIWIQKLYTFTKKTLLNRTWVWL